MTEACPEMQVPTVQGPELHLDIYGQQEAVLDVHLDWAGTVPGYIYLLHSGLCCTWTYLDYMNLCCSWTCLHYSGL